MLFGLCQYIDGMIFQNLRAIMYNLESAERSVIRRISGRIIPAIITTTSAVAGLVSGFVVNDNYTDILGVSYNCC